jgi:small conductance mechanosensitive channel
MVNETVFHTFFSSIWVHAAIVILVALLVQLFGDMVITKIVRRSVRSTPLHRLTPTDERKREDTLISVISVVLRIFIGITAFYILIRMIFPELDFAPVFASAGIVGIALGFGAQTIVKDFLAGMFIIIENQYRVGDVVDLDGAAGTVERITLRTTILRDLNGNVHYMPNGNIMHAINKTMDYGKVYFTLAVDPETDVDTVVKVINKTGEKLAKDKEFGEKIIEPPQFMNLGAFNDIALEVNIIGKTEAGAQWSVTSEMKKRLIRELAKNNIELSQYTDMKIQK